MVLSRYSVCVVSCGALARAVCVADIPTSDPHTALKCSGHTRPVCHTQPVLCATSVQPHSGHDHVRKACHTHWSLRPDEWRKWRSVLELYTAARIPKKAQLFYAHGWKVVSTFCSDIWPWLSLHFLRELQGTWVIPLAASPLSLAVLTHTSAILMEEKVM
jgi:hypothetical protein